MGRGRLLLPEEEEVEEEGRLDTLANAVMPVCSI